QRNAGVGDVRAADHLVDALVGKRGPVAGRLRGDAIQDAGDPDAQVGPVQPDVLRAQLDRLERLVVTGVADVVDDLPAAVANRGDEVQRSGAEVELRARGHADPVHGQQTTVVLEGDP